MKTKLSKTIPEDLASRLQATPEMLVMWEKLRPSCQRDYVDSVISSKNVERRQHRIERVLQLTENYYRRHQPIKE